MSETDLPELWRTLLREAAAAPDGVLSLTDDPRGEAVVDAAERLTDLGLLRIVTARRYRLSDTGRAAISKRPGGRRPVSATEPEPAQQSPGFWARLFGRRG